MDIFVPIFIFFVIFVTCSLCGFCCRKTNEGAIYSTPVIITSQTHQPVGAPQAYPVGGPVVVRQTYENSVLMSMPSAQNGSYSTSQVTYVQQPMYPPEPYGQQPMYPPANGGSAPYPPQAGAPYPPQAGAPYPPEAGAPYPPQAGAPYPPQAGAPYPPQAAPYPPQGPMQQPPAYNEVVGNETYLKQSAFNPNFSG